MMMKFILILFTVQGIFFMRSDAQKLLPLSEGATPRKELFISVSLEPGLATSVGYRYALKSSEKSNVIGGRLKFDPLILRQQTMKISLFTAQHVNSGQQTNLMLQPEIYVARLSDRAGQMTTFGFELTAMPYWQGKWSKGVELTWQYGALTYIRHSAVARETFNERSISSNSDTPVDGWYSSTASRIKLGFTTGRRIASHLGIQFSIGTQAIMQKQKILLGFSHAQVPIYLDGGFRFAE